MTSTSGLGITTITLQFDLARNIDGAAERRADRDQRGERAPAEESAGAADVQENQSGRARDPDLAPRPTRCRSTGRRRLRLQRPGAVALDRHGVSEVDIAGQQIPAVHVQVNPRAGVARHRPRRRAHRAQQCDDRPAEGEPGGPAAGVHARTPTTSCSTPRRSTTSSWPIATGRPFTSRTLATSINSSQSARTGAWFDGKRIELLLIKRQPGANTVEVVDQIKAMMPIAARLAPALGPRRPGLRPLDSTSASRSDVEFDPGADHRPRGAGDLRFPAQCVGDHHSKHDGAALARRHRRRDVSRWTTVSTTSR